ncbi:MAG: 4-hydroxybenzoate octaprenyltransferase [Pseudomonadota bacterium]
MSTAPTHQPTPNPAAQRVADAPSNNWVYRVLPVGLWPYAQLARWDRPIGWWLLLWPCWWSLAMAAIHGEQPLNLWLLALFFLGAITMRGAGCTYNDLVDHKIDMAVERTRSRPLPSGRVTRKQTVAFIALQLVVGAAILFSFNGFAIVTGLVSIVVILAYPFAKRVTDWPQFVLGLAFSWGALLGWAAVFGSLSAAPVILYLGSILWVIGYDTIYAHQDREDDALVGVRSTARLFGEKTRLALSLLYGAAMLLFAIGFFLAGAGWIAFAGLALGAAQMIWQIRTIDIDDGDQCLRLFKSNSHFGWILFLGLVVDGLV